MEETKINQKFLQLKGKVGLETEIELDQDISLTCVVTDYKDKSNNDGTVDRTYGATLFVADKFDGAQVKVNPGKMSPSQEMRWNIHRYWEEKTDRSIDFDEYYTRVMRKKNDEIIEKLN